MKQIALYPGSFDPITYGHLDLIERCCKVFDEVHIGIGRSAGKEPLFADDERVEQIKVVTAALPKVRVAIFDGLVVQHAAAIKAQVIVRGIRSVSDFTYEMQMAMMNRNIDPGIETFFIPTKAELSHVSSTLVKDVARHGGPLQMLVPPAIAKDLAKKFA